MAEPAVQLMQGLEFWRSSQWVDIWAGTQLRTPPPNSAASLVRAALLPDTSVNFPVITEICDRIADNPAERGAAVEFLGVSLADAYAPFRKKLKALTIANEMMYDPSCVDVFRSIDRLHEALGVLRTVRDSGLSNHVDENIRMLATEIDKVCFGGEVRSRPLNRLGSAVKGNLAKAASQAAGALRRERSPPKQAPAENTFYFDPEHKRWRQKGVPDEFDNVVAPAVPVDTQAPVAPVDSPDPPVVSALEVHSLVTTQGSIVPNIPAMETIVNPAFSLGPLSGAAISCNAQMPTEQANANVAAAFGLSSQGPTEQANANVAAAFGLSSQVPPVQAHANVVAAFGLSNSSTAPTLSDGPSSALALFDALSTASVVPTREGVEAKPPSSLSQSLPGDSSAPKTSLQQESASGLAALF